LAYDEQHLTSEEFSAYLDGELTSSEQERLTRHLSSCTTCEQELDELRRTIALLQALPRPALPRSFTLARNASSLPDTPPLYATAQADDIFPEMQDDERESISHTPTRSRARWSLYTRSGLRTLSALAAVIGLFLLGSSLLAMLPTSSGASYSNVTSSSGSSAQSNTNTEKPGSTMPRATEASPQVPTPQMTTKSPTTTPVPSPTSSWPVVFFFDLNTVLGRVGLGLLFLLVGGIGLFALRAPLRL
jgi:anti-sigma factor RsiW